MAYRKRPFINHEYPKAFRCIKYVSMNASLFTLNFFSHKLNCNIFTCLKASLIAACFIIAASYSEHDETLVILCFTIAISSHSLTTSGTLVNSLDLTTHYVAPLSSCVNGIGSFIGILVPWAIGHLTPSVRNLFYGKINK